MLINCPKCGKEISDKAKKCVGCGWMPEEELENEENVESDNTESTTAQMENHTEEKNETLNKSDIIEVQSSFVKDEQGEILNKNVMLSKMKKILLTGICVFGIAAIFFFSRANNVKNEYYNSENYYSLNKNAYVGRDAYNYMINGTYFTGYSVIGVGCMVCAVVMGTSFVMLKIKECEE